MGESETVAICKTAFWTKFGEKNGGKGFSAKALEFASANGVPVNHHLQKIAVADAAKLESLA